MQLILRFIPFQLLCGYLLGVFFMHFLSVDINLLHLYLLVWVLIALYLFLIKSKKIYIVLSIAFLMGILHTNQHQKHLQSIDSHLNKPQSLWIEIIKTPKQGKKVFHGIVHQIGKQTTHYKIYLYSKHRDSLKVGNWIYTQSTLKPIINSAESTFDFRTYSYNNGFSASCFIRTYQNIIPANHSLKTFFLMFRQSLQTNLQTTGLSKSAKDFISASLLGMRNSLSKRQINQYANAGVIHLLAVSGLHTGIIWGLFFVLLYPLSIIKYAGFYLQNIMSLCLLWGYVLITGCQPPVVRSAILYTCIGCAFIFKSVYSVHYAIWASAFICLWFKPYLIFSVSFQMSYAAVLAIVHINPLLQRYLSTFNPIAKYFWNLVTVCISAQLGVLPLSLYYFGKIPLLFIFSNVLIIPLFTLILLSSSATVVLSLCKLLPLWLETFLNILVQFLNTLINIYASYKSLIIEGIKIKSPYTVLGLYVLILILYLKLTRSSRKPFY